LRRSRAGVILQTVILGVTARVEHACTATAAFVLRERDLPVARAPRLFDRVREAARVRHFSHRTESA
jgi:hypothetical protein